MRFKIIALCLLLMTTTISLAQNKQQTRSDNLLKMRWSSVATRMSPEWYSSEEAKKIAETVLLFQKEIGGWEKNQQYHLIVDDSNSFILFMYFYLLKSPKFRF